MKKIDWEKNSLIPAVAQDYESGQILMLAYMNRDALNLTLETGYAHYYSRSRRRLWKKGESSNHTQEVKDILVDCDGDTIMLKVKQNGVACHTGTKSCFFTSIFNDEKILEIEREMDNIYGVVDRLYHIILERKKYKNIENSWTQRLLNNKKMLISKIREESEEICKAIDEESDKAVIHEGADLLYHTLVGLAYRDINPDLIRQELKRRFGQSGIDEKRSRG